MLRQAIRELRRHAIRSLLTAGGIAIGVGALVLLGALSERTSRLVEGGKDFGAGQITISGSGGDIGTGMTRGALVGGEQLAALAKVPGVSAVAMGRTEVPGTMARRRRTGSLSSSRRSAVAKGIMTKLSGPVRVGSSTPTT